jgi:hypothetical protein
LLQLGCHSACWFETDSPLGLLLASCRRNLVAADVSARRAFNLVAVQRNAAGVAVRSFPGTTPETNVPAQVPLWQWLGPIRFRHPRTPPIAPQVHTVDSVAKPCRGLPRRRPAHQEKTKKRGRSGTQLFFLDYRVRLVTTRPRFGGLRWWFVCLLIVNGRPCSRRVGKLYLPPHGRYFGCRHCHDLTYATCQASRKYSSLYRHLADSTGYDPATVRRVMKQIGKRRE